VIPCCHAVHRAGHQLSEDLGNQTLRAGDVLICETNDELSNAFTSNRVCMAPPPAGRGCAKGSYAPCSVSRVFWCSRRELLVEAQLSHYTVTCLNPPMPFFVQAFSLVSPVPNSSPLKRSRMWLALLLTVGMVTTQVCPGGVEVSGSEGRGVGKG
jgi:hypothetical protein